MRDALPHHDVLVGAGGGGHHVHPLRGDDRGPTGEHVRHVVRAPEHPGQPVPVVTDHLVDVSLEARGPAVAHPLLPGQRELARQVPGRVDDVHLGGPERPDDAGDLVLVGVGEELVGDHDRAAPPVPGRLRQPLPRPRDGLHPRRREVQHVEHGGVVTLGAHVARGVQHPVPGEPAAVAGQHVADVGRPDERSADVQDDPGGATRRRGARPEPAHGPIMHQP